MGQSKLKNNIIFVIIIIVLGIAELSPEFAQVIGPIIAVSFLIIFFTLLPSKEQIEANYNAKIAAERVKYQTCIYCGYRWKMRYPHTQSNPPSKCPSCNRKIR